MVRRFIQKEEVRFHDQDISQCHPLLLPATQLSYRLLHVINPQLTENLLGLQHFGRITMMVETGIQGWSRQDQT